MSYPPVPIYRLPAGLLFVLAATCASAAELEVETAADEINTNGLCSLREAVINANNGDQSGSTDCPAGTPPMIGEADSIIFDPSLDGIPIILTVTGAGENAALTGDLDVTDNLGIVGNGPDATIIDGNGADRLLDAQPTTAPLNQLSLLVESLTLRNGDSVQRGGAIRMQDTASVLGVEAAVLTGNHAHGVSITAGGGAVWAEGGLVVQDAEISDNQASAASGFPVLGGGIRAGGTFLGERIQVTGNTATGAGTSVLGGGMMLGGDMDPIRLADVVVRDNLVEVTGGGGAAGGGLAIQDIDDSLLQVNTIERTEISGNTVTAGAGFALGGGLYFAAPGRLGLRNTTVSGNTAGDVTTDTARGGGVAQFDAPTLVFSLSTVTENTIEAGMIAEGGGLYTNAGGFTQLSNTALAGNTAPSGTGPDCSGPHMSRGYNLLGSNAGCAWTADIGDQVGDVDGGGSAIDPMLDVLADNGGPSLTHAPLDGSPLVDSADPDSVVCADVDQRGFLRPIDGDNDGTARCDIGAHEQDSFLDVFFVDGFESE